MVPAMDVTNLLLAILGIGLLVAFHELGHHLAALGTGMRVRRFSVGFGKPLLTATHKGVDYTLGQLPLGGFVDIVGMNPLEDGVDDDPNSYLNKPRWARALVVVAGPAFNYALAWFILVGAFFIAGAKHNLEFEVVSVLPGSAAEDAGLRAGDVVVTVDAKVLTEPSHLPETVERLAGQPLTLQVRRGEETLTIQATPRGTPARLGIQNEARGVGPAGTYTFGESVGRANRQVAATTVGILGSLAKLFQKDEPVLDNLGGPPEIVRQLKKAASRSWMDLLFMLAGLSIMLGLMNLLPFPGLDGSKLLFLGAESVARRDLPRKFQAYVQGVGTLLLLGLVAVVSVNDLFRKHPEDAPAAASRKDAPAAPQAPAAADPAATPPASTSPTPGAAPAAPSQP